MIIMIMRIRRRRMMTIQNRLLCVLLLGKFLELIEDILLKLVLEVLLNWFMTEIYIYAYD